MQAQVPNLVPTVSFSPQEGWGLPIACLLLSSSPPSVKTFGHEMKHKSLSDYLKLFRLFFFFFFCLDDNHVKVMKTKPRLLGLITVKFSFSPTALTVSFFLKFSVTLQEYEAVRPGRRWRQWK